MEFLDLQGSVLRPLWAGHDANMLRRYGTGKRFGINHMGLTS